MSLLPEPAAFLPASALQMIRAEAAAAEHQRDLTPALLDLIYKEGWFKMLVPARLGGKALPLPQVVRLEEGLAYADGSLGWVVTLCSGAGWFGGFLPPGVFDEVLADPRLCIAGSGSPTGEAVVVAGGYRVTGDWAYASGIRHATAYTANCVLRASGEPERAHGQQEIKAFLFLPGEIRLRNDWNAMGMIASGSHGFSIHDRMVGPERAFPIHAAAATDTDRLYQYPFSTLAEVTLAATIAGMGWHFLDCCSDYFERRVVPEADALLASARADLTAVRNEYYSVVDRSWQEGEARSFAEAGRCSHQLAAKVREWADRLYPYTGLGATRMDTTICRVWRDLHTAGQHPLLVFTPRQ